MDANVPRLAAKLWKHVDCQHPDIVWSWCNLRHLNLRISFWQDLFKKVTRPNEFRLLQQLDQFYNLLLLLAIQSVLVVTNHVLPWILLGKYDAYALCYLPCRHWKRAENKTSNIYNNRHHRRNRHSRVRSRSIHPWSAYRQVRLGERLPTRNYYSHRIFLNPFVFHLAKRNQRD